MAGAALAGAFLCGAAATAAKNRWIAAQTTEPPSTIRRFDSVEEQWVFALHTGTVDAWRSVGEYFPNDAYWASRAERQLALAYLDEKNVAEAKAIFERIAANPSAGLDAEPFGLAGLAWCAALDGDVNAAVATISELRTAKTTGYDRLTEFALGKTEEIVRKQTEVALPRQFDGGGRGGPNGRPGNGGGQPGPNWNGPNGRPGNGGGQPGPNWNGPNGRPGNGGGQPGPDSNDSNGRPGNGGGQRRPDFGWNAEEDAAIWNRLAFEDVWSRWNERLATETFLNEMFENERVASETLVKAEVGGPNGETTDVASACDSVCAESCVASVCDSVCGESCVASVCDSVCAESCVASACDSVCGESCVADPCGERGGSSRCKSCESSI